MTRPIPGASIEGVTNASGVITQGAANSTVNNYGLIKGDQYSGVGQNLGAGGITVNNNGTGVIYGQGSTANSYGVFNNQNGALTLNNASGGVVVGSQYGVYGSGAATIVTNSGTIASGSYNTTTNAIVVGGTAGAYLAAGGSVGNGAVGNTAAQNASSIIEGARGVYSTGTLMLTNYGTVMGTTTTLGGIDTTGATSVITNYGTVQGGTQAIILNSGGTVYNYGTGSVLKQANTGNFADASGIYSNGALSLTNQGAISTGSTGISYGVEVIGVGTITNSGSITAASVTGLSTTGAGSSITNQSGGSIVGATGGIRATASATVNNSGLIGVGALSGARRVPTRRRRPTSAGRARRSRSPRVV